jgi:Tol biopolymer transport system component/DNA-binding winged helix-turn-helix (wHTH) protein
MHQSEKTVYSFGDFQLDPSDRLLLRRGEPVPLTPKVLDALLLLVENAGHLVEKDEFMKRLWPDSFVGDDALAQNISLLRKALADKNGAADWIVTVPKRGYRLAIEVVEDRGQGDTGAPSIRRGDVPASQVSVEGKVRRSWWAASLALLVGATAGLFFFARSRGSPGAPAVEVVPLTGMAEMENAAAFSPDGNQVAFVVSRGEENLGIYKMLIGGEKPFRLTANGGDCCPAWSPDGRAVAFARSEQKGYSIFVVPALGGTPKLIYTNSAEFPEHIGLPPTLSWSTDGGQLAISSVSPRLGRPAISLVSLRDLSVHPITSPPPDFSDWTPSFSPDGKSIAFIRSSGPGIVDDVYMVPASGGEARRLTFDNRMIDSAPAWAPDGSDIIFVSARAGVSTLWRVSASGGTPRRVEGVGNSVTHPAISSAGHRLAYTSATWQLNLWSVQLADPRHIAHAPQLLFASKGGAGLPHYSADGTRIAFESEQSGYNEIWTMNSDGSDPQQLTFLRGESGTPHWSYDGRFVAFDYRPAERSEIYIANYSGGQARMLPTNPGTNNTVPSWSRDDQWVYFASSRGNESTQIWKAHYPDGGAIQLTQGGGMYPIESADGFVYYSKTLSSDEIWKIPVEGGAETLALKAPGLDCFCNSALAPTGIYVITQKSEQARTISFYDFASKRMTKVLDLEKMALNPAVSPDGKSLIYVQLDQHDSTIMLVNHFY